MSDFPKTEGQAVTDWEPILTGPGNHFQVSIGPKTLWPHHCKWCNTRMHYQVVTFEFKWVGINKKVYFLYKEKVCGRICPNCGYQTETLFYI